MALQDYEKELVAIFPKRPFRQCMQTCRPMQTMPTHAERTAPTDPCSASRKILFCRTLYIKIIKVKLPSAKYKVVKLLQNRSFPQLSFLSSFIMGRWRNYRNIYQLESLESFNGFIYWSFGNYLSGVFSMY